MKSTLVAALLTAFPAFPAAENMPEYRRQTEIQQENAVQTAVKRFCDSAEQPAENSVLPLAETADDSSMLRKLTGGALTEQNVNVEAADAVLDVFLCVQCVLKGGKHFRIRESDTDFYRQILRFAIASRMKGGQPPMPVIEIGNSDVILIQADRDGKHLRIFHAVKQCRFLQNGRNQGIGFVDSDLTSEIDSVLPFPEFDQPRASVIVEINGQTVKNHVKTRGEAVEKLRVSKDALRRVNCGGKNVLRGFIAIAKRLDDRAKNVAFFFAGHPAYPFASLFLAASEKNKENESDGKKASDQ